MPASEKKILLHLALLCLLISAINAKALSKREVEKPNYFENMLNRLENMKNVPILGDAMSPYISSIYNTAKEMDEWSDGSLSRLVNSIFPCELNGPVLRCTGTLDRESLHALMMKILTILPIGNSLLPMLQVATGLVV